MLKCRYIDQRFGNFTYMKGISQAFSNCGLHNDKYTKNQPIKNFRVDAPVTRRTPHRSGREGLPHPVPRF